MISNLKGLWHRLTAPRTTDEDEARREVIANVIAERERLLATERAQARRQAALFRLSAELAATLEESEVCRRVVDGLHDTLGYDHLVLWLVDETSGDRVSAASVAFPQSSPNRISPGQGLSERPLLDGQLHYTPDVTQDPRYIPGLGGAEVDVPIRIGGKVLGVLTAESRQPHAFGRDDFEVLTAAAQQAGLAIGRARLLAAERQRADELDALRTTMADVTAELELSALLQAIVERAAGLLDATGGELGLYDEASQKVRIVVSHNLGKDFVGTCHVLGEGAMGCVAETGEPLIIEDYHTWEGRAAQYADVQIRASLAAPLEVSGRLVGVISIATTNPTRQFGPADLHLLKLFAQQAAIAIENARLYEGARQRAEELGAINEIAQTVTSSLDLDKVIRSVMKGINRILRVETGSLLLIDEETNELVFKITLQGDTEKLAPYRLKMGQGIAGWVAQQGKPLLVPDVELDPRHYRAIDEAVGFTSRSIMCVPLTVKEKVIGVIEVINKLGGTSPGSRTPFNGNDLELLSSMAAPVAIAIENARLHEATKKLVAADILQQTVVTVAHYINNPLTALAMSAHSLVTSAETGKVICHDDSLSETVHLTEKKVEEIAAVIGILKEMASPKSTIYLGETKMIDIREQLAERLKAIEEKYKK
jgi:GAF domain-containing protein